MFNQNQNVIGLTAIENPYRFSPLIDGLDLLLLVIVHDAGHVPAIEHVRFGDKHIQIRRVTPITLEHWIKSGENRSAVQWLVRGEVLVDRDDYLIQLRKKLLSFPEELRGRKQLIEFGSFIRTYLQAKQDLQEGNLLDAYSGTLTALHHWAHIALIEEGQHPELTVWRQMRRFNPGIYKLYEELTVSPETLEQRVRLVLLACEFSVMNKMKSCCQLLFSILASREEPWAIIELQEHPLLADLHVDLSLLVQKLVQRGYVHEVAMMQEESAEVLELRYRCEPSKNIAEAR